MRVLQINAVCSNGSTGRICENISRTLKKHGVDNVVLFFSGKSNYALSKKISNRLYIKLQAFKSRIFGNYGFNSKKATKKVISFIKEYRPDIIQIHNIHGHDIDLYDFFTFLKKTNIKVFYTFHDCWAFTGYCTHFDYEKCQKWKNKCNNCPQRKLYSWFFDKSSKNFQIKKDLLTEVDMTIITPSIWLKSIVEQSFLSNKTIKVINNGIDLSVFNPVSSNFRKKYCIEKKFILLGVANCWSYKKGIDVFVRLAKTLSSYYQIVLVGTNKTIDKMLPQNIISIHKTNNQSDLAQIYFSSDLFVNPTREDTFPTVNIEALACGTPVLTFGTGGSPEIIDDTCGSVVQRDDFDKLVLEINRISHEKPFSRENCRKKAACFNADSKYREYLELYGIRAK